MCTGSLPCQPHPSKLSHPCHPGSSGPDIALPAHGCLPPPHCSWAHSNSLGLRAGTRREPSGRNGWDGAGASGPSLLLPPFWRQASVPQLPGRLAQSAPRFLLSGTPLGPVCRDLVSRGPGPVGCVGRAAGTWEHMDSVRHSPPPCAAPGWAPRSGCLSTASGALWDTEAGAGKSGGRVRAGHSVGSSGEEAGWELTIDGSAAGPGHVDVVRTTPLEPMTSRRESLHSLSRHTACGG